MSHFLENSSFLHCFIGPVRSGVICRTGDPSLPFTLRFSAHFYENFAFTFLYFRFFLSAWGLTRFCASLIFWCWPSFIYARWRCCSISVAIRNECFEELFPQSQEAGDGVQPSWTVSVVIRCFYFAVDEIFFYECCYYSRTWITQNIVLYELCARSRQKAIE